MSISFYMDQKVYNFYIDKKSFVYLEIVEFKIFCAYWEID